MANNGHPTEPHPDRYQNDLNPNFMAGQNQGVGAGAHAEQNGRTAYDIKELQQHPLLRDLTDDQLKTITILPEGTHLTQGTHYLDLHKQRPEEFRATGNMVAGPHNWYVSKHNTDYPMWNRLRGVTDPERLDAGEATDQIS